eukprot:6272912-Alexandrium_andersonii.AAC.1
MGAIAAPLTILVVAPQVAPWGRGRRNVGAPGLEGLGSALRLGALGVLCDGLLLEGLVVHVLQEG